MSFQANSFSSNKGFCASQLVVEINRKFNLLGILELYQDFMLDLLSLQTIQYQANIYIL